MQAIKHRVLWDDMLSYHYGMLDSNGASTKLPTPGSLTPSSGSAQGY